MLDYTKGAVTRNASEKKINSLLDFVSTSTDMKLLQVHPFFSLADYQRHRLNVASCIPDTRRLAPKVLSKAEMNLCKQQKLRIVLHCVLRRRTSTD